MNGEVLQAAVALSERVGHAFVTTASAEGLPHLAAAGRLPLNLEGRVVVTEWFCSRTMENLRENRLATLVVWDPETDAGHQLFGEVEAVNDLAMLDGYSGDESVFEVPQVERELVIRVEEVSGFRQGPHSDVPVRV
jgi:hypothetical protein